MKTALATGLLALSMSTLADPGDQVQRWSGNEAALRSDLRLILREARWGNNDVIAEFDEGTPHRVRIVCEDGSIHLHVKSSRDEKAATMYHGLHKLGFLFPHPRWQISPTKDAALAQCGKTFNWRPAYPQRGFHLHTLHPNEWVKGFLEGDKAIANDTVRWTARNRQNVLDLSLLRPNWNRAMASLKDPFELAKDLGISRGVSLGAALQQQNSFKLIPLFAAMTGQGDESALLRNIRKLGEALDYDFMTMESGTSEFTAVNYDRALSWFNLAARELKRQQKKLFTKVHVSTNQHHATYGNFNFLPRFASREVGVMPHTVMFYGLWDKKVPMYGNNDFSHMLKFMREEKDKRPVWYYPETSYWVGMDVDVPLFLTDYLTSRAEDMQKLHPEGIQGHFNFTSGHEMGYWLFDWTLALNNDLDEEFSPLSGLKLLGEDEETWRRIIAYQTKHFKDNQLIAIISASNIQDELTSKHRIHERKILKEVARSAMVREAEILKLENALAEVPDLSGVKHPELKLMLEVTERRIHHALAVRKALRHPKRSEERTAELASAARERQDALESINAIRRAYNRYPSAKVFERNRNSTSYQFGYLWTAATLHFWNREEQMVKNENYFPFFMNIYNVIDIIF